MSKKTITRYYRDADGNRVFVPKIGLRDLIVMAAACGYSDEDGLRSFLSWELNQPPELYEMEGAVFIIAPDLKEASAFLWERKGSE